MSLRSRFRIGQRVQYRTREDSPWMDAKVVAFSPGDNYVHVSTDVTTGAMALSEPQARKHLLAAGEDPVIVQLTAKQLALFGRVQAGLFYISGPDVRTARTLAKVGLIELEDNGFMSQDRSGRSDGERWSVKLKGAKSTDPCPASPAEFSISGDGTHECLADEMRCAYCGERLAPYPCNGCGKFLTAKRMHEAATTDGIWRCEECA